MTTARDEMLARVRTALRGGAEPAGSIPRGYRETGTEPPGSPALLELLTDRLVDYRATVYRASPDTVGQTVAEVLAQILPAGGRVLVPPGLPAGWVPEGAVRDDGTLTHAELDAMAAVLTGCAAAAAETGTIALDGSPGQGRRAVTLIPDRHICVVPAEVVVETVPELLSRLDPTRPLTFISGPSATSDIELSRVEGVHGPRTLVVVLVAQ
ncbi:MAG TPA: LUD domain-containing protein [Micromonosporaceae bacterium]|nr:LUD domain-containing protein [Micromonosporaceae bacterium]